MPGRRRSASCSAPWISARSPIASALALTITQRTLLSALAGGDQREEHREVEAVALVGSVEADVGDSGFDVDGDTGLSVHPRRFLPMRWLAGGPR